jgi:hypothetical protein
MRRGARVDGMVSKCELSINVVTHNKPKMLTGLHQNGNAAGTGPGICPVMDINAAGEQRAPKPILSTSWNRVNLYLSQERGTLPALSFG